MAINSMKEKDQIEEYVKNMMNGLPSMERGVKEMKLKIEEVIAIEKSIERKSIIINGVICELHLKDLNRIMIQFPTKELSVVTFQRYEEEVSLLKKENETLQHKWQYEKNKSWWKKLLNIN